MYHEDYAPDGATKLKTCWFYKAVLISARVFVNGISAPMRGIIM
jgi:hypothetical protein